MSDASTRIIQHMNRDHQLALVDYLTVYGKVSAKSINARSVRISDIDTEKVEINYVSTDSTPKSVIIYFANAIEDDNVKVEKLQDLKSKLVAMAVYTAKQQGYSHKQVTKVTYPSRPEEFFLYLIFFTSIYATWKPRDFIKRVGPASVKLLGMVPDFAGPAVTQILTFLLKHGANIVKGMYVIHIIEILFVMRKNLVKYRVPPKQSAQWIFFNFVEGFYSLIRFNKLAREKELEG